MPGANGIAKRHRQSGKVKDRNWIIRKKERQRRQGKMVRKDSKYTGRKRPNSFF
jgi:18S rRNA (guanine1575-N7)-methyltransferase